MVRKLKYHEQKLLKKVDFISWEVDNNLHEIKVLRKYYIQKREDYTKYNKLARNIRELARKIKEIDAKHPFRTESSAQLLEKLYLLGIIPTRWDLSLADKVTASCFCRRRLAVVMVRNKMSETIKGAVKLIEQGHVRIGPELIKDPALLVTRTLEDFVTWVDSSKIKQHVLEYNGLMANVHPSETIYLSFSFVKETKEMGHIRCIPSMNLKMHPLFQIIMLPNIFLMQKTSDSYSAYSRKRDNSQNEGMILHCEWKN